MRAPHGLLPVALAVFAAGKLPAQTLEVLGRAYHKNPRPASRAAVLRFRNAHRNEESGALAALVLGATEIESRQFGDALEHLRAARSGLPKLEDYAAYLSAAAAFELGQFAAAEGALQPVWDASPPSPLAGKAAILQANAYLQDAKPKQAIALLARRRADVPDAQAEDLLGHACENAGDGACAAAHYRRVFVEFPLSKEAADSEAALARYAQPAAPDLFRRALKLIDGGDYARARKELEALLPALSGDAADLARVRIGAARYLARDSAAAYSYLGSFQPASSEAEAERLYYLGQCARRLDKPGEMDASLDRLSRLYPRSEWRLRALTAAAAYYSVRNAADRLEPLYRACYQSFPSAPQAAECQWEAAWTQYRRDPASAANAFEEHLKTYPRSDRAAAAMYFLGRIAEARGDASSARAWYAEIATDYPNYYYAVVARERLKEAAVAGAVPSAAVKQTMDALAIAPRAFTPAFTPEGFVPNAATNRRLERARLLASAGLDDLAESELRFGAKTDAQPALMAIELAELANGRDAPDQAIRYIKRYAPGYLSLPLDAATQKLWRLAFPLPYREALDRYSRERSLDPFLVAGLIRQESEFNARAVSRANAYGLTQVLPSTGRELGRRLNIPRFRASMLFEPDTNLRIGTYYLRALLDRLDGRPEPALASYNAGQGRVSEWLSWTGFREPAEFIESIPFIETRNYVQSVLRNADLYRRLYAAKPGGG